MGIGGRMGQMGKFCRRDFKGSLELQLPVECIAGTITRPVMNILARTDIVPSKFLCRSREGAKVLVGLLHKSWFFAQLN